MNRIIPPLLICLGLAGPTSAAGPLSEDRATEKAVAFIRGEIYGDSSLEITSHLKQTQLITKGRNDCGAITTPVWAFHFQSTVQEQQLEGWLHIDATSGDVECSTIPFLRVGGLG